jgi:hypothetical protein
MEVEIERIWELLPTLNMTDAAPQRQELPLYCDLFKKEL